MQEPSRVVLAMSGGVDSSVAAHLLLEAGHEVIGVFMRHGEEKTACDAVTDGSASLSTDLGGQANSLPIVDLKQASRQGCCTAQDALDARRVADRLGIPFYVLNLRSEFGRIIDYFVDEYSAGRTPNPCVVCNTWLKFGRLFDYADSLGAAFVATGHYARCLPGPDGPELHRGLDCDKDQSYVLFGVARHRLERMLLPVGSYRKTEIREMAGQLGMRVAEKRDSQEICFVNPGEHAAFVRKRRDSLTSAETNPIDHEPSPPGEIVTTDGRVVGHHDGVEGFTIGQRKGLGVAMGAPRYVVAIDAVQRRVTIGRHEELGRRRLVAHRLNWLTPIAPQQPFRCFAQIRYNSDAQAAWAYPLDHDTLRVDFDEPCFGVAPGQAVVCFDGDRVLGGGWIDSTEISLDEPSSTQADRNL